MLKSILKIFFRIKNCNYELMSREVEINLINYFSRLFEINLE